ncbi:MAG: saccharopine dehydrogenase family protein [Bdellovibrionota bacterium]
MQPSERTLELVVFGSTGFTGAQAAHYLSERPGCRWAIAGRSAGKLEELSRALASSPNPPARALVVDHGDREAVRSAVAQTRVALSFAGPFARYGEPIVAACAELGTHYLDITGETLWVRKMMDRHENAARSSGAILIPFSGFDSVPSDLGAWQVCEKARRENPGRPLTKVTAVFAMRGGLNGGTLESLLDLLAEGETEKFQDPSLLVPDEVRGKFRFRELRAPVQVRELGITAPPFFMAPVNTRVVYRSEALRGEAPLEYIELTQLPRRLSRFTAWGVVLSGEILSRVGSHEAGRKLLRAIGPKSGQGPSTATREHGFFRTRFFAHSGEELISRYEIAFDGDPGNKATVLMASESALCLALSENAKIAGGFWTPSTALGTPLIMRLIAAGMRFDTLQQQE